MKMRLTYSAAVAVLGASIWAHAQVNDFRPVTEAMLRNPPPGDWLNWRRTDNAWGYSPLDQINKANVKGLQLRWSWTLSAGPTEATPIVHDGVLFIQAFGGEVDALDATNGSLLWRYHRTLPADARPTYTKGMSVYRDVLIFTTPDKHLVALNMKTGQPVWDTPIPGDGGFDGAPLVVKDKVLVSATNCVTSACYIAGFDANSGKQIWRFSTIAQPGEPGGDTWNGLPADERFGGSSWTSGSYDPVTGLVYWGVGQPYTWNAFARGTSPLKPGQNNDLLYTNNTLALDPDTGKLVWHYAHLPNDTWDLDYTFERQIIDLKVDGRMRHLVVTAGKMAIIEALDAKTGEFVFAKDMGLQNVVQSIDPKTGVKTINPAVIPQINQTVSLCPHPGGARSFPATGYNPNTKTLYLPLQEFCTDMTPGPKPPGEKTAPSRFIVKLREGSDGLLGRLDAVNLETRQNLWSHRQRAPETSAALPTGGGVVFSGSIDRYFAAHDDRSGKVLWQARLNDVPNSFPITYSVNGKQYVAVSTGSGSPYTLGFGPLFPEIKNPQPTGSTLWVFALPD